MESQDVLVWGYVPGTAVLASIPLTQIITKLPSYFLTSDLDPSKEGPLSKLAWDYRRKKGGYQRYCQEMSTRFLRMPDERRLRDTTAGLGDRLASVGTFSGAAINGLVGGQGRTLEDFRQLASCLAAALESRYRALLDTGLPPRLANLACELEAALARDRPEQRGWERQRPADVLSAFVMVADEVIEEPHAPT